MFVENHFNLIKSVNNMFQDHRKSQVTVICPELTTSHFVTLGWSDVYKFHYRKFHWRLHMLCLFSMLKLSVFVVAIL